MVEVGGSNPPGPTTQSRIITHFFARWTPRALLDSQQVVIAFRDPGNACFKPFVFVDLG